MPTFKSNSTIHYLGLPPTVLILSPGSALDNSRSTLPDVASFLINLHWFIIVIVDVHFNYAVPIDMLF